MPVDERIRPTSGTAINPGGVRQLTIGEIALAKTLLAKALTIVGFGYTVKVTYPLTFNLLMSP
jgi:hypothetical protein